MGFFYLVYENDGKILRIVSLDKRMEISFLFRRFITGMHTIIGHKRCIAVSYISGGRSDKSRYICRMRHTFTRDFRERIGVSEEYMRERTDKLGFSDSGWSPEKYGTQNSLIPIYIE